MVRSVASSWVLRKVGVAASALSYAGFCFTSTAISALIQSFCSVASVAWSGSATWPEG